MSHYQQFVCQEFTSKENAIWKNLWVTVVWENLYQRNNFTSKDESVNEKEICCKAQVWAWMKAKNPKGSFSFLD